MNYIHIYIIMYVYLHKNNNYTYKYNIYKAAQFINIVKYGTYKSIYEKE
jgi:hypothetical protein